MHTSHLRGPGPCLHRPEHRQSAALPRSSRQCRVQAQQTPGQAGTRSESEASDLRAQLAALRQEVQAADKQAFMEAWAAEQAYANGNGDQVAHDRSPAGVAELAGQQDDRQPHARQQEHLQAAEAAQDHAPPAQQPHAEPQQLPAAESKEEVSREERQRQAAAWRQARRKPREQQQQGPTYPRQEVELRQPPRLLPRAEGAPPAIGEESLAAEGSSFEILLQGFNWDSWHQGWYSQLSGQAEALAALGITAIWLPPPTDSVSPQGYMPKDLYNLNSKYGSEEQLRGCIASLQRAGLKVLADIVINHRCADGQDSNGIWNQFGGRLGWDARAIVSDDKKFGGRGGRSSGDSWDGAPNLDHSQPFVRDDLTEWLRWMREDVGFDGWRFDFVRGYAGRHVRHYAQATSPAFVVGEYWDSLDYDGSVPRQDQDRHRRQMVDWIRDAAGAAACFDMTSKGILHAVFERNEFGRLCDREGRPPGLVGWWPSRAVTFTANHDTDSSQGHWRFPAYAREQGYCYVLTHPGTPCIFWDDLHDARLQQTLRTLVALRQRAGIHCRSEVWIKHAETSIYVAEVDGSLLMKIGPAKWQPEETCWQSAASGYHWQIWTKQVQQ